MLFDNSVNHCETKSSTFANFFGGEEWFENSFHGGGIHSTTSVRNAQANKFAYTRFRGTNQVGGGDFNQRCADGQLPAFKVHRITRVDGHVDDDLFDHPGVSAD